MAGLGGIAGPLILGIFLNCYAYGFAGLQYLKYFSSDRKDSLWLKFPITFMCIVDVIQTALEIYMAWVLCVENYLNTNIFQAALLVFNMTPIFIAFSGIFSRLILGYRIYTLNQHKPILAIILIFSLLTFGLAMATGIYGVSQQVTIMEILDEKTIHRPVSIAWFVHELAANLFISVILVYNITSPDKRFVTKQSRYIRFLRAVLQTGSLGTIFSFLQLVTFLVLFKTNLYMAFALPIGRLYSITTLDILASRKPTRGREKSKQSKMQHCSTDVWAPGGIDNPEQLRSVSMQIVQIQTDLRAEVVSDKEGLSRRGSHMDKRSPKSGNSNETAV